MFTHVDLPNPTVCLVTMSLAFAPLFPPTTSTSFCELLAIESCDDVLVFDGEFTPFVTVPAPSPMLSRSSSYGCEGDVSSYRTNSFSGYNYQQLTPTMPTKPNFCKQTSPTGIDSNVPMAMNEYAQLAELWSATSSSSSSAAPIPTSRTSFDSISDTSRAAESNDALLDLFIQTARPSAMASMPKLTRSVSAPVAGAFTRSPNSPGTKPAAKTKSSSKTKKCTYAARRVRLMLTLCI